jgi:hypothetical protein
MPPVLKRQNTNREGEDLQEPLTLDALTAAKEAGKITLYGFIESPPCWKVKVLLILRSAVLLGHRISGRESRGVGQ